MIQCCILNTIANFNTLISAVGGLGANLIDNEATGFKS